MDGIINDILVALKNTDWTPHLIIGYYYIDYITKNYKSSGKKFKLDKTPLKDIKEVSLPPQLKINNRKIDFRGLAKKELGNEVVKFAQIILDNFSSRNLIIFYNNISELNVKIIGSSDKEEFLKNEKNRAATYNADSNKVNVREEYAAIALPHELFHMASSFYDEENSNIFCGFSQIVNNGRVHRDFGNGFNEGYTEYMVEKYYGHSYIENEVHSYHLLRTIAASIEMIIGKEKMETLYLSANLKGLIDELSIYVGEKNAINFINCTDILLKNMNYEKKTQKQKEEIESNLKILNLFMLTLYTEYGAKKYNNKEINFDELKELMTEGIKNMYNVTINEVQYNGIPTAEFVAQMCLSILRKNGINAVSVEGFNENEKTEKTSENKTK